MTPKKEKPWAANPRHFKNQENPTKNSNSVPAESQLLPHNTEAETCLLAALVKGQDKIGAVSAFLKPDDFYSRGAGEIFRRMTEFREQGRSFNLSLLTESFANDPNFEQYEMYFLDLSPLIITAETALSHARIIFDCSRRRKAVVAWRRFQEGCYDLSKNFDEQLDEFKKLFNKGGGRP